MAWPEHTSGYNAWGTILCCITERCQIIDFPNGCWPQLGPSLWLRGPQPPVGLLNKGWLLWVCAPKLLSVLCLGLHALLSATAGRSDELALLATGLAYIHGEPVPGAWWGWVANMQAVVAGPPRACRTAAPRQGHSPAESSSCWCSCGLCGAQDNAGTATPALALAAGISKHHECMINQERP